MASGQHLCALTSRTARPLLEVERGSENEREIILNGAAYGDI